MQDRFQIDQAHARAVWEEVGERLRQALSRDELELSPDLESHLHRLQEFDEDSLIRRTEAIPVQVRRAFY